MKSLILFLFTFSAWAQFAPVAEVESGSVSTVYRSKKLCPSDCIRIPVGYNSEFNEVENELVPDITKPVYSKTSVESCQAIADDPLTEEVNEARAQEENCSDLLAAKDCSSEGDAIMSQAKDEVYCSTILRYEKKQSGRKIVIVNETKKASFEAKRLQKKQKEAALAIAGKAMKCGQRVMALLLVRNQPKSLTKPQVRNLVKTYKDIKNLLETGSLDSAREDILAVTLDPPIITQQDKDALVAELDACKP